MNDLILIPPKNIRDSVLLKETGELLVVQEERQSPYVYSYIKTLKKLKKLKSVKMVSLEELVHWSTLNNRENNKDETFTTTIQDAINLFSEAQALNASDIHIRINKRFAKVLFRVNGSLQPHKQLHLKYAKSLCATIYGAMTDVSDTTYQPNAFQDARIAKEIMLPKGLHGIRVASGPHVEGSFMVLRLLYGESSAQQIKKGFKNKISYLGYSNIQIQNLDLMRSRPTGMNIIAGPTGSGKSTTLKYIMESIAEERPELNIMTVEDPPEYPIKGCIQMPVANAETEEQRRQAFGAAIKAAMRSDPDIIMVGEIRDAETARMALRAAMTGHQVWSTIHANSGFNIINRLSDLLVSREVPAPLNILTDITVTTGLVFQRLVKKLCPYCKKSFVENRDRVPKAVYDRVSQVIDLKKFGQIMAIKGDGCDKCDYTGISGRTVVAETICTDPHLLQMIKEEGGTTQAHKTWKTVQHGMGIIQHVIQKIKKGEIDPVMAEQAVGPLTMDLALNDDILESKEVDSLAG